MCDIACGSGVFLIEACEYLAEKLHCGAGILPATGRKLVTRQCLYGADLDPAAVEAAKLSLWLDGGGGRADGISGSRDQVWGFARGVARDRKGAGSIGLRNFRRSSRAAGLMRSSAIRHSCAGRGVTRAPRRLFGREYTAHLQRAYRPANRSADLCAFFLRRAWQLIRSPGTVGADRDEDDRGGLDAADRPRCDLSRRRHHLPRGATDRMARRRGGACRRCPCGQGH